MTSASGAAPGRVSQAAFAFLVLAGAALFWMAPRPPMGDLPQHAAQMALLHDLLRGDSPWTQLFRVHYFTPYLLPYGIAFLLSYAISIAAALKLVLSISMIAFAAIGWRLARELGCDERLCWLLIPGFFGFAFQYGFYTFIAAAPVTLWFILLARRHAENPTTARALGLAAAGAILFFFHGLAFLSACAIGFGTAVLRVKQSKRFVPAALPYVLLGALLLVYVLSGATKDPLVAAAGGSRIVWEWGLPHGWHRLFTFPIYVAASTSHDPIFVPATLFMLAAPWLLGCRLNPDRTAWLPFGVMLIVWLVAPGEALGINFLYQRFAIFFLPAYLFAFQAGSAAPACLRSRAVQLVLAASCGLLVLLIAKRERAFARESAPFEEILAALEPRQRALNVVLDPYSPAIRHDFAYNSYALWYQVEKQGLVDFNFAYYLPEVVHFRAEAAPRYASGAEIFEQHKAELGLYRYLVFQHRSPLPAGIFAGAPCRTTLIKEAAGWSLYEQSGCASP